MVRVKGKGRGVVWRDLRHIASPYVGLPWVYKIFIKIKFTKMGLYFFGWTCVINLIILCIYMNQ